MTILKRAAYTGQRVNSKNIVPPIEHDACGVAAIINQTGIADHTTLERGLDALINMEHRGAVAADGLSSDGVGILFDLPTEFLHSELAANGKATDNLIGAAQVFLPRHAENPDLTAAQQAQIKTIFEEEVRKFGYSAALWRDVPVDISIVGPIAEALRPDMAQLIIENTQAVNANKFEQDLKKIALQVNKRVGQELKDAQANDMFHIASCSSKTIVYKGMVLPKYLAQYYPDLKNTLFQTKAAVVHTRFSTNSASKWRSAQPFSQIAHNGEINTIQGNEIGWRSRFTGWLGLDPIPRGTSDSGRMNAAIEAITKIGGQSPALALLTVMPPAITNAMPKKAKEFIRTLSIFQEPASGPANVVFYDGTTVSAHLDNAGLRPSIIQEYPSSNVIIIGASERGILRNLGAVVNGRLGPGEIIEVKFSDQNGTAQIIRNDQIIAGLAAEQAEVIAQANQIGIFAPAKPHETQPSDIFNTFIPYANAAGLSKADLDHLRIMASDLKKEAIGSMGDTSPIWPFRQYYTPVYHALRQRFAQVTNPPIDYLRESILSLKQIIGPRDHAARTFDTNQLIELESPLIFSHEFSALKTQFGEDKFLSLDATFDPNTFGNLEQAIESLRTQAIAAAQSSQIAHLLITDEAQNADRVAMPSSLIVSAINTALIKMNLRDQVSLHLKAADLLDTHSIAMASTCGANTLQAYVAENLLRHDRVMVSTTNERLANYRYAVNDGIKKIMSKMGITDLSSYVSGYFCEALGLSQEITEKYFIGVPSPIGGDSLAVLEDRLVDHHNKAFENTRQPRFNPDTIYKFEPEMEQHAIDDQIITALQAVANAKTADEAMHIWQNYYLPVLGNRQLEPRDLLEFTHDDIKPIMVEKVETADKIKKRFYTAAMSFGALSPEASVTNALAAMAGGFNCNSGEGGLVPWELMEEVFLRLIRNGSKIAAEVWAKLQSGELKFRDIQPKTRQVASGRFGVDAQYLVDAEEIEIKVGQGAKPGEGGQLPGFKVGQFIARARGATEGSTLISPPPHHDIYSIEDLTQLIDDLKTINPNAKIAVKLVSEVGVGTVAAGVAKAGADIISISGHVGGTGASPDSSKIYVALPWEIGLAEVNQTLCAQSLRGRIKIRADGGMICGRDLVIAGILGADYFNFGSSTMIAQGCDLLRECHLNTCHTGIATQDPKMREKYEGTPEQVIQLMDIMTEDARLIIAGLGIEKFDDLAGRTDLLQKIVTNDPRFTGIDLTEILRKPETPPVFNAANDNCYKKSQDECLIEQINKRRAQRLAKRAGTALHETQSAITSRPMRFKIDINNGDRCLGAGLASHITRKETEIFPEIIINAHGTAGQSAGLGLVKGETLNVYGDANDGVGKALSGGRVVINGVAGNFAGFGGTAGEIYIKENAGERFGVRNSGVTAICGGSTGDHALEYMTNGRAVILGGIGNNAAAGMSGGLAFIYDPTGSLRENWRMHFNAETVYLLDSNNNNIASTRNAKIVKYEQQLADLQTDITHYAKTTGDQNAKNIIKHWYREKNNFILVAAVDYDAALFKQAHPPQPLPIAV